MASVELPESQILSRYLRLKDLPSAERLREAKSVSAAKIAQDFNDGVAAFETVPRGGARGCPRTLPFRTQQDQLNHPAQGEIQERHEQRRPPLNNGRRTLRRRQLKPRSPTHDRVYAPHRVVRGQRMMQAATDIFLSWQRSTGLDGLEHDFYVRQLWDWKASADLSRMSDRGLLTYTRACAWSLARSHARSGDRLAIASGGLAMPKFPAQGLPNSDAVEADGAAISAAAVTRPASAEEILSFIPVPSAWRCW